VTIYRTLLTRGYFPKELPPAFSSEQFARYATSKTGRLVLSNYKAEDNFTECIRYYLALPGGNPRELSIVHPFSFAQLAALTAKNFSRLLTKAARSPFSRSRPVYAADRQRAIYPMVKTSNLAKERAISRAGGSFLLKADVSQFYPSLYTHAVGWAIDPKLRLKKYWKNQNLLGKKLDQAVMDANGKISQGIPIGNDISFLLAEAVLAQVDRALTITAQSAYRWFDDYEISFDTREQAEAGLARLRNELDRFQLRLNPVKTQILDLPVPTQDEWHESLFQAARVKFDNPYQMVNYFDIAFRYRKTFPETAVLLYALGILFKLKCPKDESGLVAQSCITQAFLCEPGAAQKAFALLTFWRLNGFVLDKELLKTAIGRMIRRHRTRGPSSDIAWALSFCIEEKISLDKEVGRVLSGFDDDCILLQALHLRANGLLPSGFNNEKLSSILKGSDLDREHWLLAYETVRQGFLKDNGLAVKNNPLFGDMLANEISFYRTQLPPYALVVHPGGAPDWLVRNWLDLLRNPKRADERREKKEEYPSVLEVIEKDLDRLKQPELSRDEMLESLMAVETEEPQLEMDDSYPMSAPS
jgi:hypothetical protein